MFKYTLLMLTLVSTSAWAQRTAMPADQIQTTTTIPSHEKSDNTEILNPGNWDQADEFFLYTVPDDGGFVVGTNVYGDLSKAQQFNIEAPLYLHGVYFWFAGKNGETGTVDFNVWDFDDQPGELLLTQKVSLEQVTISDELDGAYYYEFTDGPILVERSFLLGFYLGNLGNSSLGMVSSADGQGGELGLAWEQWDNGAWYTFLDPDGWGLDIDLGIFPLIEWADDDPGPGAEGISNIRVAQRTDGSGLVDVTYNFTADAGQYLVDLALSLDGGNTYSPVNPTYLSNHWPVTPGDGRQLVLDAGQAAPGASTDQARLRLTPRSGLLVTTAPGNGITSEAATIAGEVLSDGGYAITARGVAYDTAPNPLRTGTSVSGGSGTGRFTADITGLMPNTTYYARAWATNSQGTEYGNQVSFTTLAEGPMVIFGPDGSRFVLPDDYPDFGTTLTIEEHPFEDVLIAGQQAASKALRIHIENGEYVGGDSDYDIDIPLIISDADPRRLRLIVRLTDGERIQLPGEYDAEENRFLAKTLGLAHGWVVGVAQGSEIRTVSLIDKEGTWPSLNVTISDTSQDEVRLSEQNISNHILPVARDAMITLQSSGFNAPNLRRTNQGTYKIILDNKLSSFYAGPQQNLLGKVVVGYKHFATDVSDPSTWRFEDVCIHETFHGVQYSYGQLEGVAENFMFGRANGAYKEGTATLIGATYETKGSLGKGAVHVRLKFEIDGPHDLGTVLDDIAPTPYDRQDFFAFLAKRYFEGNLNYMHEMFKSIQNLATTNPSSVAQDNNTKRMVFRKGLHNFLINKEKSLPEAYSEYALQRLYYHEPAYLLRGAEDPAFDDRFTENRLAKHLLEKSKRHTEWLSARNDTILFAPVIFEDLNALSSAAATLTIPTNVDPDIMPDTLSFMFSLSGTAQINSNIQEEGIRIVIIRATDQYGTPAASQSLIHVANLDEPVGVPINDDITHLVFLLVNAYVEDIVTDITAELFIEETIYDFPGISITLNGHITLTDDSTMPTGGIAWGNNDIPALKWTGRLFSASGRFTYFGDQYDISISGRISPDGKKIETLHATSMMQGTWVPGSSTYREIMIQNFPLRDISPPWVAGSNIPGNEAEPMVTKLIYERKYLDENDEEVTIGLQSVDWGSQQTQLSVHFSFMHSAP